MPVRSLSRAAAWAWKAAQLLNDVTRFIGPNAASIALHSEIANQQSRTPSVSLASTLPGSQIRQ
jgi:hypothetical protein